MNVVLHERRTYYVALCNVSSCDCHVTSGKANSHCTDGQQLDDPRVIKLGHLLSFSEEVNNLLRMMSRMLAHCVRMKKKLSITEEGERRLSAKEDVCETRRPLYRDGVTPAVITACHTVTICSRLKNLVLP